MSQERVDKKWLDRGVESYSTEAILGTLAHYGVTVTETEYLALAKDHFPLSIAEKWHETWKGTGQFTQFPAAAAEELWSRLKPGEIAPTDLALALVKLLQALDEALEGKADDGTRDTRFKVVENYLPKVPTDAARRDEFLGEMFAALGEWVEVFDEMPPALVVEKLEPLAERLVAIDESLFPEHLGVSRAALAFARGDTEQAVTSLRAIANDAQRVPFARLSAVEALIDEEHLEGVAPVLISMLDLAEKERDVELASDATSMLQKMLKIQPNLPELAAVRSRIEALLKTFRASDDAEDDEG